MAGAYPGFHSIKQLRVSQLKNRGNEFSNKQNVDKNSCQAKQGD